MLRAALCQDHCHGSGRDASMDLSGAHRQILPHYVCYMTAHDWLKTIMLFWNERARSSFTTHKIHQRANDSIKHCSTQIKSIRRDHERGGSEVQGSSLRMTSTMLHHSAGPDRIGISESHTSNPHPNFLVLFKKKSKSSCDD
jgi:hypothetical protein